jgi:signal transduction histidine kinase
MQNVIPGPAVAVVCLLAVQAALVLLRSRSCVPRSIPLFLAAFLVLVSVHAALSGSSPFRDLCLVAIPWTAGSFLLRASGRRIPGAWTSAGAALACTLLLARALGYGASFTFTALRACGALLLAALPLGILLRMYLKNRSIPLLGIVFSAASWTVIGVFSDLNGSPFSSAPELLLSLCTGWLIFQEGYPQRTAGRGSLPALAGQETLSQALYSRMSTHENALAGQDRITAAGFLALGAAHEFKNMLSLVRLAARHGLERKDAAAKDDCLRLIMEHAGAARDSSIEVLERISSGQEDSASAFEAAFLSGPIRRAGAALRGQGIIIQTDLGIRVLCLARRADVERIVLNLVQNAADSYYGQGSEGTHVIWISARAEDECAVIEVRDAAGGVDERLRHTLFTPSFSGKGGTGLGLYLARNLALANGGTLDYRPLDGGSVFILGLPGVDSPDDHVAAPPRK